MPFVSVFFHFIIDWVYFAGQRDIRDICFLNFTYARVCIFIFVVPDVPLSRLLGGWCVFKNATCNGYVCGLDNATMQQSGYF